MATSGLRVPASMTPRRDGLGFADAVAFALERGADETADLAIVLDDEHLRRESAFIVGHRRLAGGSDSGSAGGGRRLLRREG